MHMLWIQLYLYFCSIFILSLLHWPTFPHSYGRHFKPCAPRMLTVSWSKPTVIMFDTSTWCSVVSCQYEMLRRSNWSMVLSWFHPASSRSPPVPGCVICSPWWKLAVHSSCIINLIMSIADRRIIRKGLIGMAARLTSALKNWHLILGLELSSLAALFNI